MSNQISIAQSIAQHATTFSFGEFAIERRDETKDSWAVLRSGLVWTRSGEWVYEPMSSSRDEAFLDSARWTLEEALAEVTAMTTNQVAEPWVHTQSGDSIRQSKHHHCIARVGEDSNGRWWWTAIPPNGSRSGIRKSGDRNRKRSRDEACATADAALVEMGWMLDTNIRGDRYENN